MAIEEWWAIIGECGLYQGIWFTRKEAITAHTSELGRSWEYCRAKGDRAVRVSVKPITKRRTPHA